MCVVPLVRSANQFEHREHPSSSRRIVPARRDKIDQTARESSVLTRKKICEYAHVEMRHDRPTTKGERHEGRDIFSRHSSASSLSRCFIISCVTSAKRSCRVLCERYPLEGISYIHTRNTVTKSSVTFIIQIDNIKSRCVYLKLRLLS